MTSRAPTTPAMMDVTWLRGRRPLAGGTPSTQRGGGTTQPHSYLGFWSTGHPSSSRIVHLGTQGAALTLSAAPCSCQHPPGHPLLSQGPPTHEWVQLVGQSWHTPNSSGYFQTGTKEASALTPLGQRLTHCWASL